MKVTFADALYKPKKLFLIIAEVLFSMEFIDQIIALVLLIPVPVAFLLSMLGMGAFFAIITPLAKTVKRKILFMVVSLIGNVGALSIVAHAIS